MKTEHYKRVEEFMVLARQQTPSEPTEPSRETRALRAKLILEEALETITKGLGVVVTVSGKVTMGLLTHGFSFELTEDRLVFHPEGEYNEVETIDGCLDVAVVTTGTLVAIGVPDEQLLALVDENNLAKFGPGGYRREDGKWMKPPGHKPPDIRSWLAVYREHLAYVKRVEQVRAPQPGFLVLPWQKIETAPKNQFVLLVWRSGYVTTEWDYGVGCWSKDKVRWNTISGDNIEGVEYWCPLPNAPEWQPVAETEVPPVVDPQDTWD